jgi:hypothetical protein
MVTRRQDLRDLERGVIALGVMVVGLLLWSQFGALGKLARRQAKS